jgi:hypothetical protein
VQCSSNAGNYDDCSVISRDEGALRPGRRRLEPLIASYLALDAMHLEGRQPTYC